MKMIVVVLFFVAFLVAGVLGPGTAMLFLWPALLAMAVVGVAGMLQVRERFNYRPSVLALWAVAVFLGYVGWRAAGSEVEYLARPDLYLVAGCFLCFVGGAVLCEGTASRKALVYAWAVLVAGNVVMGCYQYFGDPKISVLSPLGFFRVIEDRQAGGFFNLG
ncbi:MAG: hypothetical protein P8J87_21165, partial [Verrucomicrobiales bacterium]|nr:hypothetical protein [Verrucomicrobiales bacterium]